MEAKVKILFIDDDITFGRICTIILQEKGYEVFYQTTLNGAKACIAEAHPDIIVLDVEIGNQNGIEVAPEITVIGLYRLWKRVRWLILKSPFMLKN